MYGSILESYDLDSLSFQEGSAFCVVFCSQFSEMRCAVQFDGNVALDAEKVDNIATYAVLAAESLAQQLSTLKM
jgi:hypothetical protein